MFLFVLFFLLHLKTRDNFLCKFKLKKPRSVKWQTCRQLKNDMARRTDWPKLTARIPVVSGDQRGNNDMERG